MARILFVDDEKKHFELADKILQLNGHNTIYAYDFKAASTLLEKSPYDLVATDYNLDGENGLYLAKWIKKNCPGIPVLLHTANDAIRVNAEEGDYAHLVVSVIGKPGEGGVWPFSNAVESALKMHMANNGMTSRINMNDMCNVKGRG